MSDKKHSVEDLKFVRMQVEGDTDCYICAFPLDVKKATIIQAWLKFVEDADARDEDYNPEDAIQELAEEYGGTYILHEVWQCY